MKHLKRFNESVALNYMKELYNDGGMSTDVYQTVLSEDTDKLTEFDKLEDKSKIKRKVLELLDDIGGISSDVYSMELENL
jgi:hypothetical protein